MVSKLHLVFLLFVVISVVTSSGRIFIEIVTKKTSFSRGMTIKFIIFMLSAFRRIEDYFNRWSDSM